MMSWRAMGLLVLAGLSLCGCANSLFSVPEHANDEAAYEAVFPWYAEFCALSEIDKKPGFGAEIVPGGPGGHSILYLSGVCRVKDAGYPVLRLCDAGDPKPGQGVGISVNDHYRNANWIATEGRDFVFRGDLAPGEPLTKAAYLRTQRKAEAMGILDGIQFHRHYFDEQPPHMAKLDFMYDLSVATDYAVGFGRDRYCARVPLDRAKMAKAVSYLNAVNAPYRSGQKVFNWSVFENNCAHLAHNVLAVVGLWPVWPTDRPFLIALLDFPVPKNEFVNLMRRTNDVPIDDPDALYDDVTARAAIEHGWMPTEPGGLAEAKRAIAPNEVYNTQLRLIFYDDPLGPYQGWFDQIFAEPRYTSLRANLAWFAARYASIPERPPPAGPAPWAAFQAEYYRAVANEKARLDAARRVLSAVTGEQS